MTGNVTFTGDNTDGINLDSWGVSMPSFNLGSIVTVNAATASYKRDDNSGGHDDHDVSEFAVGVQLHVASSPGLRIHVRFADGGFQEADFTHEAPTSCWGRSS